MVAAVDLKFAAWGDNYAPLIDVLFLTCRYVIGKDGTIAYKGGLGPDHYDIPEMTAFLQREYFTSPLVISSQQPDDSSNKNGQPTINGTVEE